MSGPLTLNAEDARTLGAFLDGLSKLTARTGWRVGAYGRVEIARGDQVMSIGGGNDGSPYVVDDRIGD